MTGPNSSPSAAERISDRGAMALVMDGRMPDILHELNAALTIGEIAALTRAKPRAGDPLDRRISNIAPLDTAVAVRYQLSRQSEISRRLGAHARRRLPDRRRV